MPRSRKGGVLLPTASNASNVVAVPIVAYDLANLDDRQYRGYVLFRKLVEGGKRAPIFRSIDESTSVYSDRKSVV